MLDCSHIVPGLVLPNAAQLLRYPTKERWAIEGQHHCGASTAPKWLGLSPYGGRWSAWARKALPYRYKAPTKEQLRGHREEPRILEDWAAEMGGQVQQTLGPLGELRIIGEDPWWSFTPDAFAYMRMPWCLGWVLVELKTDESPGRSRKWGRSGQVFEAWTEEAQASIREDYGCQLQLGLAWSGLEWGVLIVKLGLTDMRWYAVRRDPAVWAWARPQLEELREMVDRYRAGDLTAYPDPDSSDDCQRALVRLFRDEVHATREATPAEVAMAEQLRDAEDRRDAENDEIQHIKNIFLERLGAEGLYGLDLPWGRVLTPRSKTGRYARLYRQEG